jgi:hypothetical protein
MKTLVLLTILITLWISELGGRTARPAMERRGAHFLGVADFRQWNPEGKDALYEQVLVSPDMRSDVDWDEMVVSWNADTPVPGQQLRIEARGIYPDRTTKWYTLGVWASGADVPTVPNLRESVRGQKDADGDVETDILVLKRHGAAVQLRVTLNAGWSGKGDFVMPRLRYVGLCFLDSRIKPDVLPPNKTAWGKTIDVPEKCQGDYPNGSVICSPTCTSMVLNHWSRQLKRPDLARDVPEVCEGVFDPNWPGTGNWPFNTAYAGSFKGMRGYVARFTDVSEIEDWIAAGIPVVCSVSWDVLRGKDPPSPSGHLVVCVGFTKEGDPVINDPARNPKRGRSVRTVYPRKNLVAAWAKSKNTVYLIYPESAKTPADRFGHWEGKP